MADNDDNKLSDRAKEIGEAIRKADDKRRADAENASEGMNKIMEAIEKVSGSLESLSGRMDALETAASAKPQKRDDAEADNGPPDDDFAMTTKERADALTRAQVRADEVANHHGKQAPKPLSGESPTCYRKRVLRDLKHDSADYKDVDLGALKGQMLDIAERRIFADSIAASARPSAPEGELVERVHVDPHTGSRRIEFYGDPAAWMDAFKQRPFKAKIARPNREW